MFLPDAWSSMGAEYAAAADELVGLLGAWSSSAAMSSPACCHHDDERYPGPFEKGQHSPEAFQNPDFQRGLKLFLSRGGKAARFIITHDTDPATPAGISAVKPELNAAHQAVKGTTLTDARFYLAGTAAIYGDIHSGSHHDLMIVGIAALTLIFAVMVIITRALVASLVIVGTVLLSLGAAFGLSVLVWQHLFGLDLNWIAPVFGLTILLAVGSDYNLLLVSR